MDEPQIHEDELYRKLHRLSNYSAFIGMLPLAVVAVPVLFVAGYVNAAVAIACIMLSGAAIFFLLGCDSPLNEKIRRIVYDATPAQHRRRRFLFMLALFIVSAAWLAANDYSGMPVNMPLTILIVSGGMLVITIAIQSYERIRKRRSPD